MIWKMISKMKVNLIITLTRTMAAAKGASGSGGGAAAAAAAAPVPARRVARLSLSDRLAAVEYAIGSGGIRVMHRRPQAASKGDSKETPGRLPSAVAELAELTSLLRSLEDKTFAAFYKKYWDLSWMLENETDWRGILASAEVKESLLLSAQKDITLIAKQLQALHSLAPALDASVVPNLPDVQARLNRVEAAAIAVVREAQQTFQQLQQLLDSYNEYITSLSKRLVFWDGLLQQWSVQLTAK